METSGTNKERKKIRKDNSKYFRGKELESGENQFSTCSQY